MNARRRMELSDQLAALTTAADAAAGRLPDDVVESARALVGRAGERRELSGEHTVVALAGPTGSGKSSMFNAVSGLEVSRVGVRRPTTAHPIACIWGTVGAAPLLDWLGVPRRHQIARESVLDSGEQDDLDGLILLDLPDHDSTALGHREIVDRLIEMVDVFVWVLDPQKYADGVLHERYLRPLAAHREVTVVVLNQIDRLEPADVKQCLADLRHLLDADGLGGVPVLPTSVTTGAGIDEFIDLLRNAVAKRRALDERLQADVSIAADALLDAGGTGDGAGAVRSDDRRQLIAALAEASGVDVVAEAVGHSYLGRARRATGWPLTRWLGRLRRDPLRRLGLERGSAPELTMAGVPGRGRNVSRTSLPAATPVQKAQSDTAIRRLGDAAAGSAAAPWRASIRGAASASSERLPDALDQAVAHTELDVGEPRWWSAVGFVQWFALAVAAAGGAWLLALAAGSFLQLDLPTPKVEGLPIPTVLLVTGALAGVVIGAASFGLARAGARRRAAVSRRRLRAAVEKAADEVVVAPIEAELERYETFRRELSGLTSR